MAKQKAPLSVRLDPQTKRRLEEVARRLKKSTHTLAQEAIEAAVDAIEKEGFRAVIPLEFELQFTHVPIEKRKTLSKETIEKWVSEVEAEEIAKINSSQERETAGGAGTGPGHEAGPPSTPGAGPAPGTGAPSKSSKSSDLPGAQRRRKPPRNSK